LALGRIRPLTARAAGGRPTLEVLRFGNTVQQVVESIHRTIEKCRKIHLELALDVLVIWLILLRI
jgi:hypothetical protein